MREPPITLPPDGGALTKAGVAHLRTALVAAGFAFFPEITGRKQSIKAIGTWVGKCGTFNPAENFSNRYGSLHNTALYLDGLFAIDIDVDEPAWVEEIVVTMASSLGQPGAIRYRANSPRLLALYQAPPDACYTALKGSDGMVEIFTGPDQKITAFGVHTTASQQRTRLCWDAVPGNVTRAALPMVSLQQRDAFLTAITDMLGEEVKLIARHPPGLNGNLSMPCHDLDALLLASQHIPNSGPLDWPSWNRIGMALYAASDGDLRGLQAYQDWTCSNPLSRHRDCIQRWSAYARSPPTRIGAGTIFYLARQAGYQPETSIPEPRTREQQITDGRQNWQNKQLPDLVQNGK